MDRIVGAFPIGGGVVWQNTSGYGRPTEDGFTVAFSLHGDYGPERAAYRELSKSLHKLTPSRKTDPGNVRESSQPKGLERILYEEATQCGADRGIATSSGRIAWEGRQGSRGL